MKRIVLILLTLYASFSSCKHPCPGYDANDKSIIPFRLDDEILYRSDNGDELILIVTDYYITQPHEIKVFAPDYGCIANSYYIAMDEGSTMQIEEDHELTNYNFTDKIASSLTITFNDTDIYNNVGTVYEYDVKMDYMFSEEVDAIRDGFKYNKLWIIRDTSGNRSIDYFVKGTHHGIIEFHDKVTDLTWKQVIEIEN
jgi:alpha-amylase/alpha-mannosidase (GH57 family)